MKIVLIFKYGRILRVFLFFISGRKNAYFRVVLNFFLERAARQAGGGFRSLIRTKQFLGGSKHFAEPRTGIENRNCKPELEPGKTFTN
ncbi:TPA: hypothetical protein HA351_13900 [Methanosarcinaceae archaeon]|nr:hypothetical protein [Methanosarcinaceae archaeon]